MGKRVVGQILNPPMWTCEECPSGARCIWSEQKYSRGLLLQAKQKILKMKAYEAGSNKNYWFQAIVDSHSGKWVRNNLFICFTLWLFNIAMEKPSFLWAIYTMANC